MGIKRSPGCKCCGPCGAIAVTVSGCPPLSPLAVQGATVTVKQSATTIGTCMTDASGQCSVPITVAGSYTVSVAPPSARFAAPADQTFSATCTTNARTFQLTAAPGYGCLTCCGTPIPNNLTLSIGGTTVAMGSTKGSEFGNFVHGQRFGCKDFTAGGGDFFDGISVFGFPCGQAVQSVAVPIGFSWDCDGLVLYFEGCCKGTSPNDFPAMRGNRSCAGAKTYNYTSTKIPGTLTSCNPLLWTGTFNFSGQSVVNGCSTGTPADRQFGYIWPGSVTFTLQE